MRDDKQTIRNLVFTNMKIEIVTVIMLMTTIILLSVLAVYSLPQELKLSHINLKNTELFIDGDESGLNLQGFEPIFTFHPLASPNFERYKIDDQIDVLGFKYDNKISNKMFEQLANYDASKIELYVYPDYTDKLIKAYALPNLTYDIDYFIAGSYPQGENEAVVSEFIANILLNQNNLDSYKQLLGTIITLNINNQSYSYTISGVVAGNKDLLVSSSNSLFSKSQPQNYGYYRNFETRTEKELFIDSITTNNNINYLDSENYNYINFPKLLFIIAGIIQLILCVIILSLPLRILGQVLRHYNSQPNWYLIYTYPAMIVVSIIIINLILIALY